MGTVYIAVDGDGIGNIVGRMVLSDNPVGMAETSKKIKDGQRIILSWAQDAGGQVVSEGGDEAILAIPEKYAQRIEDLRMSYRRVTGATLSAGVGSSLSEAGKALAYSKVTGKNKTTKYTPDIEAKLHQVKSQPQGEEETKESQAYLNQDEELGDEHVDQVTPVVGNQPEEHADYQQGEQQMKLKDTLMKELNQDQMPDEASSRPSINEQDGGGVDPNQVSGAQDEGEQAPVDEQPMPYSGEGQEQPQEQQPQGQEQQMPQQEEIDGLKQSIGKTLDVFAHHKQAFQQMSQQQPDLYMAIHGMVTNMVKMGTWLGLVGGDQPQQAPEQAPQEGKSPEQQAQEPMSEVPDFDAAKVQYGQVGK